MDLYELIEYYCDKNKLDLVSEIVRREFGNFYFEDDIHKLNQIDPKRIWTELYVSNGNLFITNHFDPTNLEDVNGWFVFERPYSEAAIRVYITTVSWVSCSCIEESEDVVEDSEPDPNCAFCHGNGTVPNYTFG